jgi:hypothetical protein
VQQQTPYNEVHALNVANRIIVLAECEEDPLQRLLSKWCFAHESFFLWECATHIPFDLDRSELSLYLLLRVLKPKQILIQLPELSNVYWVSLRWVSLLEPSESTATGIWFFRRFTRTFESVWVKCLLLLSISGRIKSWLHYRWFFSSFEASPLEKIRQNRLWLDNLHRFDQLIFSSLVWFY